MKSLTAVLTLLMVSVCAASAQNTGTLEVPFRFEHGEIFVSVNAGGNGPYTMLFDTNSDPSVVSLELARSAGWKLKKIGGGVSGGGTERPDIYLTAISVLQIGDIAQKNVEAVAMDLGRFRERLHEEIHGIIGHNVMNGRVVTIDYPNHVLRFSRVAPPASSKSATFSFRFDEASASIIFDGVTINGKSVAATLDTGSDGTFKLTPAAIESLGLSGAARAGKPEESTGYNGIATNTVGTVDDIAVGEQHVASPEVVFFGKGTGRDKKPWGVNIGNAFLKHYRVIIDFPKKQFTLATP